ncbi:hypothetical protein EVAR_8968_1 [Eumeta japonica]|uniref:Uncharacterized protein n=1 Tax=Eumeta variegata TaxID=151549 RepID=A0A4C1WPI7_EUMVA|nr:hypothetical protein EVAR_8968_1 [Eumeta japonica]
MKSVHRIAVQAAEATDKSPYVIGICVHFLLYRRVAKADERFGVEYDTVGSRIYLTPQAGQLVNVVFGADAPCLARTIEAELKNEDEARRGLRTRPQRAPHELTPQEQELVAATERAAAQRRAREQEAALAARQTRRELRACRLEAHFADVCPALLLPHAQKHLRKVADALEPHGISCTL